jgi:hypothetical protein
MQSSSKAVDWLGTPIKKGWLVQGSIRVSGPSGHAELAIPVSGTHKSGKLYVIAEKKMGRWLLTASELEIDGQSQRLTLVRDEPSNGTSQ